MGLVGLAITAAECYYLANRKKSQSNVLTSETTFSKEERKFCFAIASYMEKVDGRIDDNEIKLIQEQLSLYDEEDQAELKKIISHTPDFNTIVKMYNAIKDKHNDVYINFVDEIERADGLIEDSEKVFFYKLKLLFNDMEDDDIYKIVKSPEEITQKEKELPVINYITEKDVKHHFPDTIISFKDYYLLHPADDKELISLSSLLSSDFVKDKDTEILEAMRIAGAKQVYISEESKDVTEKEFKDKINAGVKIPKKVDIGAKQGLTISNYNDLQEKQIIQVKFKGIKNVLPFEKQKFLKSAKWIKNDSKLSWLFNSRFQANPVTEFYWETDYNEIVKKRIEADIAMNCGISKKDGTKISAEAGASADLKGDKLNSVKKVFYAIFE